VLSTSGVAGLRGPTVARVFPKNPKDSPDGAQGEWFALTIVVGEDVLLHAVETLRRAGASEITATQVRYVFEHRSWTFESLKRQLHGESSASAERVKTTAWSSA
jgi:hypothetical protein